MVTEYTDLDRHVEEIQGLEKGGDEIDREITQRLEDAFVTPVRPGGHPRADGPARRRRRRHPGGRRDVRDLRHRPADRRGPRARPASSPPRASSCSAALRKLDGLKGLEPHLERVHDLEHEADALSRAAIGRLFRESTDPIEVIKWRDLYRELENAIDAAEDAAEAIERMYHKAT